MHIHGGDEMQNGFLPNLAVQASGVMSLICCVSFASITMAESVSAVDYADLSEQQQADVSRFLGWVWGDGRPLDTDRITGIRSEVRHAKYMAVVERLLKVPELGIQLGTKAGKPDKLKIKAPWNFWNNSLPGGNPTDPQFLRDAIRNPNFLAGVIEGEGGRNDNNQLFYIDDHFHGPARMDKLYGLAQFGPERVLQLFELLGETYGFTKTSLRIGGNNQSASTYTYAQIDEARTDLHRRFDAAKSHNQAVNKTETGSYHKLIPTHIYIHPDDWDTLRSYGFFFSGRIPTSPTGTPHRSVADGTLPANDLPLATGTMSFFGQAEIGKGVRNR